MHIHETADTQAPGDGAKPSAIPPPSMRLRNTVLPHMNALTQLPARSTRSRTTDQRLPRPTGATRSDDAQRILDASKAILLQGELLLGNLGAEAYTRRLPVAFNASIGGHYRHCLDHFQSFLGGAEDSQVDYDHRRRDPRIETDPAFALEITRTLRRQLGELSKEALETQVTARCEVSYSHGDSPVTGSTLGRELVYSIAHAIHHYALISVMARLSGVVLPETFGVAPSTVAYQQSQRR